MSSDEKIGQVIRTEAILASFDLVPQWTMCRGQQPDAPLAKRESARLSAPPGAADLSF